MSGRNSLLRQSRRGQEGTVLNAAPCDVSSAGPGLSTSVKLPYGEAANGEIVHISTVENGLACKCVCPGCGARLVARTRGKQMQPHFAHYSSAECATAYETALHKLAKEVIAEHKRVKLPAVIASYDSKQLPLRPERNLPLDHVTWEQQIETIRPDVVAHWRDRRVLIEVKVTHGCDDAKLNYLHTNAVSAFEINLSRVARDATIEEITHQVLDGAPRYWLFHQAQIDKEQELREAAEAKALRLRTEKAARAAAALAKARDDARPFGSAYRRRVQITAKGHALVREIEDAKLESGFLTPQRGTKSFTAQHQVWQAALIKHYVLDGKGILYTGIKTPSAVRFLESQSLVGPELVQFTATPELLQAIRELEPDFAPPAELVEAFLTHLGSQGLLRKGHSGWEADDGLAFKAREQALRERHVREDLATLERIVANLAAAVPPGLHFNRYKWLRSPHGPYQPSPLDVVRASSLTAAHLIRDLKKIAAMLVPGGKSVAELLDLPFEAAREARCKEETDALARRRIEAEQKAAAEARGRKATLVELAKSQLADIDAECWWKLKGDVLAADGISEEQLVAETRLVHATKFRRQQEEKHLAKMAPHRETLRQQAIFILHDEENADWWLNQYNSALGAKPIDYCVDHAATQKCVTVLKETWGRKRR